MGTEYAEEISQENEISSMGARSAQSVDVLRSQDLHLCEGMLKVFM